MSQTIAADVLTLEEVAAYLRLSPEVVEAHASAGSLPGRRIADTWRFLRPAIDEWLRAQDSRTVLLQQAGVLADDETLADLRASIYAQRRRSEAESNG
jgi:excisionase family DNA binding protein